MSSLGKFTHFDLLFPSKYLKAGDLQGKEVTVVIDDIEPRHELRGTGGKKDYKPLLLLKTQAGRKLEKGMVLNKTNGTRLARLYGPEVSEWIGKTIILHAEQEAKSDTGMAVRIVERVPRGASEPAPKAAPKHDPKTGEVKEDDLGWGKNVTASTEADYNYGPPAMGEDEPGSDG